MIRKIVLTNFMAHAHTEIQLDQGLNVLVGPNNIGKSTIALALKILARNTNSNFVMQHDQKECSVSVETSEGHRIDWIKRKSPSYVINGQAKDRLGRGGTPPELDSTLRLAPVEFEDKDFEPHFGEQKSPIFLINRPASQIAQFFSTTSDAEKLVAMQRLHQRNRNEILNQSKWLATKQESVQQCLDSLQSVPSLEAECRSLELDATNLESLALEISQLQKMIANLAHWTVEQQVQSQRMHCLKSLMPTPEIHSTGHLQAVVANWETTRESEHYYGQSYGLLEGLVATPKMVDELPLANVTGSLEQVQIKLAYYGEQRNVQSLLVAPDPWVSTDELQRFIDRICSLQLEKARLSEIGEASERLTPCPPMDSDVVLVDTVRRLEQVSNEHARYKEATDMLRVLVVAPLVVATEPIATAIGEMEFHTSQFKKYQELLEQVQIAVAQLEEETANWLSTEPTCQSCGSVLSAESLRSRMHQHGNATK